ncbi:hypothetical protein HF086_015197 [Spodoptera exigua]|uniref:Fatty acyl-CoA reductase n=1 Tax=Spodoptera exigua TaxID=7107 RepID=A0A922MZM8_SPOEX|nr:hypothetical protein HF086_015197 [Spodoptera exigua]
MVPRPAPQFPTPPLIPEYFAGREVLITGATGFMGKVLVERLLWTCPDIGRLHLLMRHKRDVAPDKRLALLKQSQSINYHLLDIVHNPSAIIHFSKSFINHLHQPSSIIHRLSFIIHLPGYIIHQPSIGILHPVSVTRHTLIDHPSLQYSLPHWFVRQVFDVVRERCPQQLDKLCMVPGDVTKRRFGFDQSALNQLNQVSVVFHSAATLKFDEPLSVAAEQNVRPVLTLMDICDQLPNMQVGDGAAVLRDAALELPHHAGTTARTQAAPGRPEAVQPQARDYRLGAALRGLREGRAPVPAARARRRYTRREAEDANIIPDSQGYIVVRNFHYVPFDDSDSACHLVGSSSTNAATE